MQFLILGLALLVLVLLAGRAFTRANPKSLAMTLRRLTGGVLLGTSVILIVTGRIFIGLPLALFALSLLGLVFPWQNTGAGGPKSPGQRSSVRTDMLEMTLDHDTGQMDGLVLNGHFAGQRLSELSAADLNELLQEARARDPQSAQLLEAFIDRAEQGGDYSTGSGKRAPGAGAMTIDEAYAVLGLRPGANRDDIQQAHRTLMKKYHPDQGGTTYLATKINEAKDILLKHVHQ